MRNRLISAKARASVVAIVACSALAVGVWAFYPREAAAQANPPDDTMPQTTGFMQIGDGETTTCGLLVPAVQKVRNVRFQVMGADGREIFGVTPPDDGMPAFFDVTFHKDRTGGGDDMIIITGGLTGEELGRGPSADGRVMMMVQPGLTRDRKPLRAVATYQMFDMDGATLAHHRFFAIVDRS